MVQELQITVFPQEAFDEDMLRKYLLREKGILPQELTALRILRRSIDARRRPVRVNLSLRLYLNEQPSERSFRKTHYPVLPDTAPAAIVVGAGPAGLFAALRLIEKGIRPIIVERGKEVHSRRLDIARISREHTVDPDSNYSFGEGGAGAYSDGKLYTRSKKRGDGEHILHVFCQHGAKESILFDAHPHIGTDKLPGIIEGMRRTILSCGGEVHFSCRMTELLISSEREPEVIGIRTADGREFHGPVILATGHSARDVYAHLYRHPIVPVHLEAKGIAVGVRLEHPQELIDRIQYHDPKGRGSYLPAAEYSFVAQSKGRGVYSFCMCPGGTVVPAATAPGQVVVNGMSSSSRGGRWANSGMVVEIRPEDVGELFTALPQPEGEPVDPAHPLCLMHFQAALEHLNWQQGGGRQTAPAQRMGDFVQNRLGSSLPRSSYSPGLVASPLHFWMPGFISSRLQEGFRLFGKRSRGFLTNEAVLIGVETRTSAPVRIVRSAETLQHRDVAGLFPCGEGAGYAGGIVSAGVDGERCADALALYLGIE